MNRVGRMGDGRGGGRGGGRGVDFSDCPLPVASNGYARKSQHPCHHSDLIYIVAFLWHGYERPSTIKLS